MAETLTLERAVEAMARAINPQAFTFTAERAGWAHETARKQARAALAALVKEAGLDDSDLRYAADCLADADMPDKPVKFLRVLAEASDAPP